MGSINGRSLTAEDIDEGRRRYKQWADATRAARLADRARKARRAREAKQRA